MNNRKSRLQSWLGESATPGEEQSEGGNGPDSKELSGLALDSVHSGDQEESKAGITAADNAHASNYQAQPFYAPYNTAIEQRSSNPGSVHSHQFAFSPA